MTSRLNPRSKRTPAATIPPPEGLYEGQSSINRRNDVATASRANIEAWTEQAMASLSLSESPAAPPRDQSTSIPIHPSLPTSAAVPIPTSSPRGTAIQLDISLDTPSAPKQTPRAPRTADGEPTPLRRKTSKRDSLARREALLVGKPGSRQRRKYENSLLLSNPYAEPPEPRDWLVYPTHPVKAEGVPYAIAGLWEERNMATRLAKEREEKRRERVQADPLRKVPREVRRVVRKSEGARDVVKGLEERVRGWLVDGTLDAVSEAEKAKHLGRKHRRDGSWEFAEVDSDPDSPSEDSDEEVVFVGRAGDSLPKAHQQQTMRASDALIFDAPADDRAGAFGRWLLHTIAAYYDLNAWSVLRQNPPAPATKEAYVGLPMTAGRASDIVSSLPRPLWLSV